MPFLQVGYKRIFYTDTHPEEGTTPKETFIFTHGLGSTSSYYFPIIPALASAPNNFRCIAYDTTGQGQSPYTQVEQSISTLAKDVIGVLDALKVEKAVMVGHSMGAVVAPFVAADHSDRIVAAILIGPVLPTPEGRKTFEKRIEAVEKGTERSQLPMSMKVTDADPCNQTEWRQWHPQSQLPQPEPSPPHSNTPSSARFSSPKHLLATSPCAES